MPIEIRELVIKTEIKSGTKPDDAVTQADLSRLKASLRKEIEKKLKKELKQSKSR